MLSVEMKINGDLISKIYAVNKAEGENDGKGCWYDYSVVKIKKGKTEFYVTGQVYHVGDEGAERLLIKVLEEYLKGDTHGNN